MKIAIIGSLFENTPPLKTGSISTVVFNLASGLAELAVQKKNLVIHLLAAGNVEIPGVKYHRIIDIPINYEPLVRQRPEMTLLMRVYYAPEIDNLLKQINPDVIINAANLQLIKPLLHWQDKTLNIVHNALDLAEDKLILRDYPNANYIAISHKQKSLNPSLNWKGVIWHGLDIDSLAKYHTRHKNYFLFLGRIAPIKGLKEICLIYKQASQYHDLAPLIIAGRIEPGAENYFRNEIKPLVDGKKINYIGEVGGEEKYKLVAGAIATLLWYNVEEAFGLPMVESLVLGTPVIANVKGAASEILEDGVNGFLASTVEEYKRLILDINKLSQPNVILSSQKFSRKMMAVKYLRAAEAVS